MKNILGSLKVDLCPKTPILISEAAGLEADLNFTI
jgi:hypothetical protein